MYDCPVGEVQCNIHVSVLGEGIIVSVSNEVTL